MNKNKLVIVLLASLATQMSFGAAIVDFVGNLVKEGFETRFCKDSPIVAGLLARTADHAVQKQLPENMQGARKHLAELVSSAAVRTVVDGAIGNSDFLVSKTDPNESDMSDKLFVQFARFIAHLTAGTTGKAIKAAYGSRYMPVLIKNGLAEVGKAVTYACGDNTELLKVLSSEIIYGLGKRCLSAIVVESNERLEKRLGFQP